jgi:hypothetical protein
MIEEHQTLAGRLRTMCRIVTLFCREVSFYNLRLHLDNLYIDLEDEVLAYVYQRWGDSDGGG